MSADTCGFHLCPIRSCAPQRSAGAPYGTRAAWMAARKKQGARRSAASELQTKSRIETELGILQLSATVNAEIGSPAGGAMNTGSERTEEEIAILVADALTASGFSASSQDTGGGICRVGL